MKMIGKVDLWVQESDIDELGHVNNARFLEYFEHGRLDWYNRCDPTLNNLADHSLATLVVNIDINYRRECFSGAQLSVITKPGTRGRTSYVLQQEIYDHEGRCVCDAKVTSVVMDMSTRKTASLPESLANQFGPDQNQETS